LELINVDILNLQPTTYNLQPNYKLIANIPYNITGQIFRKFLTNPPQPSFSKGGSPSLYKREVGRDFRPQMMVVMVQKEVGERLLGKKSRSILSLLAELYGKVEKVCDVSPGSFFPAPKVESMVVKIVKNPPPASRTAEKPFGFVAPEDTAGSAALLFQRRE